MRQKTLTQYLLKVITSCNKPAKYLVLHQRTVTEDMLEKNIMGDQVVYSNLP